MMTQTKTDEQYVKDCFSYALAERLAAKGMKSVQLAKALEVTPVTVTNWTKGRNVPQLRHLVVIARLFGVTVSDLFPDRLP